jgi:hypothetical protein
MKRWGSEIIIEVEDVIRPEKVVVYKAELNVLRDQLSAIANNLIIMERLTHFPYHLFVPEDKRVFWLMTNKAFFDSTVLAFSTVLAQGGDSISLRRFKRKIVEDHGEFRVANIDPEVRDILNQRIRSVNFEKLIKPVEERIRSVRNQHVAHLDPNKVLSPEEIVPYRLSLATFRQALEVSNQLFQILGLGIWYKLEFWDYGNSNQKLDIDEILEMVVGSSFWFCDDSLIDFDEEYEKLSDEDKVILDEWRRKLGE